MAASSATVPRISTPGSRRLTAVSTSTRREHPCGNYLEEYEQDTGEDLELDVIGLCCDFTEYETAVKAASDYGFTSELEAEDYNSPEDFEEAKEYEAREWLEDRTIVIDFDSGLIIQNF